MTNTIFLSSVATGVAMEKRYVNEGWYGNLTNVKTIGSTKGLIARNIGK